MQLEHIKNLISISGESDIVELKKSTANLKSAAQTLCAFLNGRGGTVFIGVADDHTITGQSVTDKTKLDISNVLTKLEPAANVKVDYISVDAKKKIVALTAIPDSGCVPYCFIGCPYERQLAQTHVMSQPRYQQLLLSRNIMPKSWETQLSSHVISDLDAKEIRRTVELGVKSNHLDPSFQDMSVEEVLTRFKLLRRGQLINAAIVLFISQSANTLIQCSLRMARFEGLNKGDFLDSKQVTGNAFYLLSEAENFIRRNTAISGVRKQGQMERQDEPEYPFEAVREALNNAICHRDYASSGSAVTIMIYDDRLEIINTGLLPTGITLAELKQSHSSHPRNPYITQAFYRRGLIEEMGIGTQEIFRACARERLREPEFIESAGTLIVRLWSRNAVAYIVERVSRPEMTARQEIIFSILQLGDSSPRDIMDKLGESMSERTLRRDLQVMKKMGVISNHGQVGPKTKWFVVDITRT